MFCLNRENIIKIQIGFGMFQVNPLTVKNQNQFLSCKIVGKLIRLGPSNTTHILQILILKCRVLCKSANLGDLEQNNIWY